MVDVVVDDVAVLIWEEGWRGGAGALGLLPALPLLVG